MAERSRSDRSALGLSARFSQREATQISEGNRKIGSKAPRLTQPEGYQRAEFLRPKQDASPPSQAGSLTSGVLQSAIVKTSTGSSIPLTCCGGNARKLIGRVR